MIRRIRDNGILQIPASFRRSFITEFVDIEELPDGAGVIVKPVVLEPAK